MDKNAFEILSGNTLVAIWKNNCLSVVNDALLPMYLKRINNAEMWLESRAIDSHRANSRLLKKALRLADFIEIGELMARDALNREESCGGHFREEYQTPEGEALRQDDKFSYVSCWEFQGEGKEPKMYKEPLDYEFVVRQTRNYKA